MAAKRVTMPVDRLPHGYTNATRRSENVVIKRYLGPDARARQHSEVTALRYAAGRLPVPTLLHEHSGEIGTEHVAGSPGQEVLEHAPEAVLHSVGRAAARLHGLEVTDLHALGPANSGAVLVHGDFGPQNMLLDPATFEVTAIVDWEFAHLGDGLADLAWAEWIVRTHHGGLVGALGSLYEGYGDRSAWPDRQAAMIVKCQWALGFVTRWSSTSELAQTQWQRRLEATKCFRE